MALASTGFSNAWYLLASNLLWNSHNIYLYESRDLVVNWHWPRLPVYVSRVMIRRFFSRFPRYNVGL